MGTLMTIRIWAESNEAEEVKAAADDAFATIAHLESLFSDYERESEVVRLALENPAGTAVPISKELFDILSRGEELSRQTNGALPEIFSRAPPALTRPEKLAQTLECCLVNTPLKHDRPISGRDFRASQPECRSNRPAHYLPQNSPP